MHSPISYHIALNKQTLEAIVAFKDELAHGTRTPGARLQRQLSSATVPVREMTTHHFIEALLGTKYHCIFAESEIRCDGSDWTLKELALLGDINVTMPAEFYDNGVWAAASPAFKIHTPPLNGYLFFTPGVLLNVGPDFAGYSPDHIEVADSEWRIDQHKYEQLVERRLLPIFVQANNYAAQEGKNALVTLPGIGCGAFAGAFKGEMGERLNSALRNLLEKHAAALPHVKTVYFDPFSECGNETHDFGTISYRVRPARQNNGRPQLCAPRDYEEAGDDFSNSVLCKVVAWDHASLPGNDYFMNSRMTDDGVSAAASNSMESVTGIKGNYSKGYYNPPAGYRNWDEVAFKNSVRLKADGNIYIVAGDGSVQLLDPPRPAGQRKTPSREI